MPMQTRVTVGWGIYLPVDEGRRLAQAIDEADRARLQAHNEELLGGWPPPPPIHDDHVSVLDGAEFSASHVVVVVERTRRRLPWGRDFANKPVDVAKMGDGSVAAGDGARRGDCPRERHRGGRAALVARVLLLVTHRGSP